MRRYLTYTACLSVIAAFLLLFPAQGLSQGNATDEAAPQKAVQEEAKAEEVKELEQKEEKTKEEIEATQDELKKAAEEAERIKMEKEKLEKEALLKAKEAEAAKKEAELLEKEAAVKADKILVKEAEKLATEAEKLEEEAAIQKEKLKVVETKEELVNKRLEEQDKQINALMERLKSIKTEKAGLASLTEKLTKSVPVVVIGLMLFLMMKLGLRGFEKVLSKKKAIREDELTLRMKTLSKLINWLGSILIFIVVVYLVLENFGFSVAPLIAGAGIVGLAFGFGGQYLIRDLINGLFILIEDQYRINDVVKIGDLGGLVEDINLRITTLRDLEGRVIIIPNGEIKTVINYTKGYAQALFDIGVAYKENVDRVMKVIKDVGKEMRNDEYYGRLILDDLEMFGVDAFANSAVIIKFRIKTLPIKQWEVMREFRRRLKNRFDELGIEIPFPHTTLYWGTGRDNDWMRAYAVGNRGK
jgi:small conductance mechanosensitive channel